MMSKLKDLERRIEELERRPYPFMKGKSYDCGCPIGHICNSTACPRNPNITCENT